MIVSSVRIRDEVTQLDEIGVGLSMSLQAKIASFFFLLVNKVDSLSARRASRRVYTSSPKSQRQRALQLILPLFLSVFYLLPYEINIDRCSWIPFSKKLRDLRGENNFKLVRRLIFLTRAAWRREGLAILTEKRLIKDLSAKGAEH